MEELQNKVKWLEKELSETRHALRILRESRSGATIELPGWKVHYLKKGKLKVCIH
jgi:hypothetical protein